VVIKDLKPLGNEHVKSEIMVLYNMKGGPNVAQIIDVIVNPANFDPCIVMEQVDTKN